MAEPKRTKIGSAVASPTKDFFVRMLTRDIELQDAVLDLLDNCVDGIHRVIGERRKSTEQPYEGFWAKITIEEDHFVIEDNCGGIPKEIGEKYAFAMGRPPGADAANSHATVGLYGIGMKRAIFKLGTDALVESWFDKPFSVEFSSKWMSSDTWQNLPMYSLAKGRLRHKGTKIEVYDLREEVAAAFREGTWVDEFRKVVARQYAIIIAKGFSVQIGSSTEMKKGVERISPTAFRLLKAAKNDEGGQIQPYVYVGELDGVNVEIYAGLYRELLNEEENESEEETRGRADDAGWTVACNDRIVIWKDKTRLTGWGEANVPNYHGQFIAITGIVLLDAEDPKKLPLTTTKKGIDAASNIYSEVKDLMREATKSLTSFTNKWKRFPDEIERIYRSSAYIDLATLRELPDKVELSATRKLPTIKKFEPNYPVPVQEKTNVRVSYSAAKKDVAILGRYYFDDERAAARDVGEASFEAALKLARADRR